MRTIITECGSPDDVDLFIESPLMARVNPVPTSSRQRAAIFLDLSPSERLKQVEIQPAESLEEPTAQRLAELPLSHIPKREFAKFFVSTGRSICEGEDIEYVLSNLEPSQAEIDEAISMQAEQDAFEQELLREEEIQMHFAYEYLLEIRRFFTHGCVFADYYGADDHDLMQERGYDWHEQIYCYQHANGGEYPPNFPKAQYNSEHGVWTQDIEAGKEILNKLVPVCDHCGCLKPYGSTSVVKFCACPTRE